MDVNEKLSCALSNIREIIAEASYRVAGKEVTILSSFNGQPHGRSRKSLKGSIQKVKHVTFDGGSLWLWLEDGGQCWCAIGVDEVEFLSDCGDRP